MAPSSCLRCSKLSHFRGEAIPKAQDSEPLILPPPLSISWASNMKKSLFSPWGPAGTCPYKLEVSIHIIKISSYDIYINNWVGQKVHSGFSVTSYGKNQMNFSANPTHIHRDIYIYMLIYNLAFPILYICIHILLSFYPLYFRKNVLVYVYVCTHTHTSHINFFLAGFSYKQSLAKLLQEFFKGH